MKYIFLSVVICLSSTMLSQNFDEAINVLKSIDSSSQVDSVKTLYPKWQFFENTYSNEDLVSKNFDEFGISISKDKTPQIVEKLLETDSALEFRVRYIYLDGNKRPKAEIDSLRQLILQKFDDEVPFPELAKEYSDDPSASKGGDLGWFAAGVMVPSFENAIKTHDKGDIFLAEAITSRAEWYFVILKTHEDRTTEITKTVSIQIKKQ